MSDDLSDGAESVVGMLTEQIEAHFGMGMDQLRAAVGVAPTANPEATEVVAWHARLVSAQSVLDRAEEDLLAELETQPIEFDDRTLGLAQRVTAAVAARDGRALVVWWLLDPDAREKKGLAAEGLARLNSRALKGPAVQTSAPHRPAAASPPAPRTGRSAR